MFFVGHSRTVVGGVWQILWGYAVIQDKRPATTERVAFRGSACLPFTLWILHPKLKEQSARLYADDAGVGEAKLVVK